MADSQRIVSSSTVDSQLSHPNISSPLSAGNVTTANADAGSALNGGEDSTLADSTSAPSPAPSAPTIVPASSPALLEDEKITRLLNSDTAIEVLLGRLKKSINTCEELTKYIRKRAILEQDHEEHMKKITRATQDVLKTNGGTLKQDSFVQGLEKLIRVDDRIATSAAGYSKNLFTMHDELSSMASTFTRQRKGIKENFKRKEKEVVDAISSAEKAKAKYDQLCVELERVRTTDPSQKKFTLKGSKTASEQEEILHRKIEAADSEYRQRVSTSTGLRSVFLNTFRPNTSKQLKDLIIEIDIAMSVQLQKYATQSEAVVLQTAISITPIAGSNLQSMKTIASSIDNEKDLSQYLLKNIQTSNNKSLIPVEYRQHPSMAAPGSVASLKPKPISHLNPSSSAQKFRNVSGTSDASSTFGNSMNSSNTQFGSSTASNAFTKSALNPVASINNDNKSVSSTPYLDQSSIMTGPRPQSTINNDNVPLPPGVQTGFKTFGTPITELIEFEGEMVPSIVRQCIYVVDKYGIELEGIYRTSGNIATVNSLRDMIDKDPSNIKLILPNPNSITDSDIYAVASLLKNYFSSLPEALVTNVAAPQFLEHIKIPEPDVRLKKIHQVVYELPDGSYWTLRSLIFHLAKIASKQDINLMSQRNLGIIWGPTLFPKGDFNASDMSYQGKLIEELIIHANDIFEAE